MSLDISLVKLRPTAVFEANITHNLTKMADAAGIYKLLWRPEELGITVAGQLIEPLTEGLALLKSAPERFKPYEPENKWGTYDNFLPWIERLLEACKEHPDASISVWR